MESTINKRQSKNKAMVVEQLSQSPIVTFACKRSNISRATFYKWCHEDNEFAQQVNEAVAKGNLLINDIAEATVISLIKDKDLGASAFWLKHHSRIYSPKIEISANANCFFLCFPFIE